MRTCTRCGVEFESASEWCIDCMEVEEVSVEWPSMSQHDPADKREAAWAERWEVIKHLYNEGKYDNEIAAEVGVSAYTIFQTRTHAGKPANKRDDRYLWHDKTAQQQHAAQMVTHRKQAKRGKKASFL